MFCAGDKRELIRIIIKNNTPKNLIMDRDMNIGKITTDFENKDYWAEDYRKRDNLRNTQCRS